MKRLSSSFRDPCGFIYQNDEVLYRQINMEGKEDYDCLMKNGLYDILVNRHMLVSHKEISLDKKLSNEAYRVIEPQIIPYISYPYEWSFDQYRDAAILTLDILLEALNHQMILKDASAYNVQFLGAVPVFIDTLSLTKYKEGQIWEGYGQFCRHFLAPILLMSGKNIAISKLMRDYIDGLPLDIAADLLGGLWRWKISVYIHIYMHAKMQHDPKVSQTKTEQKKMPLQSLISIIHNLKSLILWVKSPKQDTEWAAYYDNMHNYNDEAFAQKHELVNDFLKLDAPQTLCDMGANRGEFSKLGAQLGAYVVAADIDPTAVNQHYLYNRAHKIDNILPLLMDLTNPSPAIGWGNEERKAFTQRGNFDCIMALALIHHLAISNNLTFEMIASFFCTMGKDLIIEFVPKTDSQVQKLLLNRKDIFDRYDQEYFEEVFCKRYDIVAKEKIAKSERTLYLLKKRNKKEA